MKIAAKTVLFITFVYFYVLGITNLYIYESAAANIYKNGVSTNMCKKKIIHYLNRGPLEKVSNS